jgi:hypothetical protein
LMFEARIVDGLPVSHMMRRTFMDFFVSRSSALSNWSGLALSCETVCWVPSRIDLTFVKAISPQVIPLFRLNYSVTAQRDEQ